MSDFNYYENLIGDLAEQFKEQPNIISLVTVIAKQMQEVWQFFSDLGAYRVIDSASGKQLDYLGASVGMTRERALQMAAGTGVVFKTEDDLYRAYIKYQMSLNKSQGTYSSVMNSIHMQTSATLGYGESPEYPATIILNYEMFNGDDHNNITAIPIAKPSGVGIVFRSVFNGDCFIYVGGGAVEASNVSYSMLSEPQLPNCLTDENDVILADGNWWILYENWGNE